MLTIYDIKGFSTGIVVNTYCKVGDLMTIEEAKQFYMDYGGDELVMGREAVLQYAAFQRLAIQPHIIEEWRQQLIEKQFNHFFDDPMEIWQKHRDIIRKMLESTTSQEENANRLIEVMTQLPTNLEEDQRLALLENMVGRNVTNWDAGVRAICTGNVDLAAKMDAIVKDVANFNGSYYKVDERKEELMRTYKRVYRLYAKKKRLWIF